MYNMHVYSVECNILHWLTVVHIIRSSSKGLAAGVPYCPNFMNRNEYIINIVGRRSQIIAMTAECKTQASWFIRDNNTNTMYVLLLNTLQCCQKRDTG